MKVIITLLLTGLFGGCAVLDAVDAKLRAVGALPGAQVSDAGIDPLAVVAVDGGSQQGVGVVVEEGLVFTAYHVVRNAPYITVKFFGHYRSAYHKEVQGRVVYRNAALDQALIAVNTETPHRAPLGKNVKGAAYCITLEGGRTNRFGQVLSFPTARKCRVDGPWYTPETPTRKGDSGGPIVLGGRVVGLVRGPSLMITPCQGRLQAVVKTWSSRAGAEGQSTVASPTEDEAENRG